MNLPKKTDQKNNLFFEIFEFLITCPDRVLPDVQDFVSYFPNNADSTERLTKVRKDLQLQKFSASLLFNLT